MGLIDRVLRIVAAIAIAVLYFTNVITGTLGIVLLAIAGILLITSIISYCPAYSLFSCTTRGKIKLEEKIPAEEMKN